MRDKTRARRTTRRLSQLGIVVLIVAAGLSARVAHASPEQSAMWLHAQATLSPYPCPGGTCTNTTPISATSGGYLTGTDANNQVVTVTWPTAAGGVKNTTVTLDYNDGCGSLWPMPSGNALGGTITVGSVDVIERSPLTQPGSLTINFGGSRSEPTLAAIGQLSATLTVAGTIISFNIGRAAGLMQLTPIGTDLCPGTGSQQFSIDGAILTAL